MRWLVAALAALAALASVAAASGAGPIHSAVIDPDEERPYDLALRRVTASGASFVRTTLAWESVAPAAPAAGTDPSDPANAAYRWSRFDDKLRAFDAAGLQPIVAIMGSPRWARQARDDREALPEPRRLAEFAHAVARRYDGRTPGLPAVRHWQLWIEPNVSFYFQPQLAGGRPISPVLYRQLLQAFTPAIRRGNPAARVVAGSTSPYGKRQENLTVIAPMRFLRDVLCISGGSKPRRRCRVRVPFDIWAHHPYTSGGPRRSASRPDDVAIGDLPELRRLLSAGQRLGQIDSRGGAARFWVTEFSWDSNPPDPKGVPAALHARWTAESLYRMWAAGVSLVAWLALRDEAPPPHSVYQSGLWYRGETLLADRPKPALQAFRFPFVAFPRRGHVFVWGRTPPGRGGSVLVERSFRGGWARLGVLRTNAHGIFSARFSNAPRRGMVRARVMGTGERARPFSLVEPPHPYYFAFGS